MLFAAGLGTRMRPLTLTRPKPLIPVAGRALIDHALDLARGAGAAPMVANLHYLPQQLRDHLGPDVKTVTETPTLLDTGGGLKNALDLLSDEGGPVFTLNTDAVWKGSNPLTALANAWREDMEGLLLLLPREAALGYTRAGDFAMAADGRLTRAEGLVYSGAGLIRTDRVRRCGDEIFSLLRIWEEMSADGTLHGIVWPGAWCDVGHPEGIRMAEDMLAQ